MILAAYKGHTDVVDMLVDQYNCPLTDVNNVSAFDVLACQVCGVNYVSVSAQLLVHAH